MKKSTDRINAKLTVLRHLQGEGIVDKELVPAAKARLGAELVDAMRGESVQSLLDELKPKRDRLADRRFEPGDEVSYEFDSEATEKSTVVWSDADHTKLKSGPWRDINTVQLTSTELEELNELIAACNTLLMS